MKFFRRRFIWLGVVFYLATYGALRWGDFIIYDHWGRVRLGRYTNDSDAHFGPRPFHPCIPGGSIFLPLAWVEDRLDRFRDSSGRLHVREPSAKVEGLPLLEDIPDMARVIERWKETYEVGDRQCEKMVLRCRGSVDLEALRRFASRGCDEDELAHLPNWKALGKEVRFQSYRFPSGSPSLDVSFGSGQWCSMIADFDQDLLYVFSGVDD